MRVEPLEELREWLRLGGWGRRLVLVLWFMCELWAADEEVLVLVMAGVSLRPSPCGCGMSLSRARAKDVVEVARDKDPFMPLLRSSSPSFSRA